MKGARRPVDRSPALLLPVLITLALRSLLAPGSPAAAPLGPVTHLDAHPERGRYTVACGLDEVRIEFYADDCLRIWVGPGGVFTDPAGPDLFVLKQWPEQSTTFRRTHGLWTIETTAVRLEIQASPFRLTARRPDGTVFWSETRAAGIDIDRRSSQSLELRAGEHWIGGGVRHGEYDLRGTRTEVGIDGVSRYQLGDCPNPVPLILSSEGYGIFRNLFEGSDQRGRYEFTGPVVLTHNERRFDAFYFFGTPAEILERYTWITGRAPIPPLWALTYGNADCYALDYGATTAAIDDAASWRAADMPGGFLVVNDQYGCEYRDLERTVAECRRLGFRVGLWTSTGLERQAWEVGTAGVRFYKLDGGWTLTNPRNDPRKALLACAKVAWEGIEANTFERGFGFSIGSWAGSQRYFALWTGDQRGTMSWIRWSIAAQITGGMSGLPYNTSDLGGYDRFRTEYGQAVYLRDLQAKSWTPFIQGIRAAQPYRLSEPYLGAARATLEQRMRLLPYLYSYCAQAHQSGWPIARALAFAFPQDSVAWSNRVADAYMCGEYVLVAPAAAGTPQSWDRDLRRDIYLPEGEWMRWNRPDEVHRGPVTLRDYPVPLAELPVFLRAGAIIPQWPSMLHVEERAVEQIEFLIWPSDRSSFDLYEDDGVTRDYQRGRSATTRITAERFPGGVQVRFHPRQGAFEIGPREHRLRLLRTEAETVTLDGVELSRCADLESLSASAAGWCIEAGGAITQIKYRSEGRGEVIAVFEAGAEPLISGAAAVHPQPQRAGQPIQFYLPDAPGAEITLLDAAGRRCSVLRADRDGKATWSGLRDDGAALPAGVYLYLARGPRGPLRGKITLLP